jgi:hypothetical protein
MKNPGFSTARAKPVKLGPLTTVASVKEARSLTSPALKTKEAAAAGPLLFSVSNLPFKDAFILVETARATNGDVKSGLFI